MCLSNSSTISRGVICDMGQFFDGQVAVGVNADVRRNVERTLDDVARGQISLHEGEGGRLREAAARADGDEVVLGFDDVAVPEIT